MRVQVRTHQRLELLAADCQRPWPLEFGLVHSVEDAANAEEIGAAAGQLAQ